MEEVLDLFKKIKVVSLSHIKETDKTKKQKIKLLSIYDHFYELTKEE